MTVAFELSATAEDAAVTSGNGVAVSNPGVSSGALIIVQTTTGGNGTSVTAPSGWTTLDALRYGASGVHSRAIHYKIAGGSEPASYTFLVSGQPGTTRVNCGLVSYTGVDATTPIDVWNWTTADLSTGAFGPLPELTTTWGVNLPAGDLSGFRAFQASPSANWLTTAAVLNPNGGGATREVAMASVFNIRSFTPPTDYTERIDFGDYSQTIADGWVSGGGGWSVGHIRIT